MLRERNRGRRGVGLPVLQLLRRRAEAQRPIAGPVRQWNGTHRAAGHHLNMGDVCNELIKPLT